MVHQKTPSRLYGTARCTHIRVLDAGLVYQTNDHNTTLVFSSMNKYCVISTSAVNEEAALNTLKWAQFWFGCSFARI